MRALSMRQPYAELIPSTYSGQALREIKRIEYRNRTTPIIGERFFIYPAGTALGRVSSHHAQ